ncbi:MAG: Cobalt-precorrin-6A reductase [Dehalococcoidia bacterium]|nr:Cobalt-precorrin-6A reductase [Bacillota bacterium]MBT9141628.1 Cobalt-precorrin-6A reductase [Bacillota bacterium]
MILVLAGTTEARSVIDPLQQRGYKVIAATFSKYGKALLNKKDNLTVRDGGLDQDSLVELTQEMGIKAVVDATHPFAVKVSSMAMTVCSRMELCYIRYERGTTRLTEGQRVIIVGTFTDAAQKANGYKGCVFLTVGVNHLETFCRVIPPERIVARVLPQITSLEKCLALGIAPANVLAMQGPFSQELNRELFRQYSAGVVVTKDSGETGGVEEKLAAAAELDIPVIMVQRPRPEYPVVVGDIEGLLGELERRIEG